MTNGIYPLPDDVVHLIAAGEVIDSFAAVVRELVENSLDAGATRIDIGISPDQWRVRVADNGRGMALADLHQAAAPHATSKIRNREDLWQIHSLGFRGEALYSLAQLADLEILSQAIDQPEGWRVIYTPQGEAATIEPTAIAPGTVVTVTNLFGNWVARRRGLPSPWHQLRQVQTTIQNFALCHPQVTWQVQHRDRPWFAIWAGTTARQILPQLLREVRPEDLQEVSLDLPLPVPPAGDSVPRVSPSLYLLVGLPDRCHRRRPDWVRVAVNGRLVKLPELEQGMMAEFRRTLPRDRYPVCFLHLHLPADQIDWNRHPAKAEIYLHHREHWQQQVSQAIAQCLHLNPQHLSESAHSARVATVLKTAEAVRNYGVHRTILPDATPGSPSLPLTAIAQVHQMYILVEHPAGLWLVEQHIAHERVLYEELCDRWHLVALEPPVILNPLSPAQLEQFQRLGIEVEPFGEQTWAVRQAPTLLAQREDCADALVELSQGGDLQAAQVATACRSAIRNGTPLTLPEMQTLIQQWQRTRNPRTCPHGRPIFLSLEESALARFFRRHWVIGKSHGI